MVVIKNYSKSYGRIFATFTGNVDKGPRTHDQILVIF